MDRGTDVEGSSRAVVTGKDNDGVFTKFQSLEFGDDPTHELVHVGYIVLEERELIRRARSSVRCGKHVDAGVVAILSMRDLVMDIRHRVIEVERLVAVALHEVGGKFMHPVGKIFPVVQRLLLAVEGVGGSALLVVPVFAARGKAKVFVESPIRRLQGKLRPFSDHAGDVAGGFQHGWHHHLVGRLQGFSGIIAGHSRMECVAARQQERPGRTAQGRGIAVLHAKTVFRQGVYIGRLEIVRPVTTHVTNAQIISENEDDVRTGRRFWCFRRGKRGGCNRKKTNRQIYFFHKGGVVWI